MKYNNKKNEQQNITISPKDTELITQLTYLIKELKELVIVIIILVLMCNIFFR